MDRKRKSILTKLKALLEVLDEEDEQVTCAEGDAVRFVRNENINQERYPTCPVMKHISTRNDNSTIQSTVKAQNYPLVLYRENILHDDHKCSCISLGDKEFISGNPKFCPLNGCSVIRPNSPKHLVLPAHACQLCPIKASAPKYPYENRYLRPRKALKSTYSCRVPPRCTQSKELRGGIMFLRCDCDKTNGLQDKCLRFCCIKNPKYKQRPAACVLSRFSGGKHLPNIDNEKKTTCSNYNNVTGDTNRINKLLNLIDDILPPDYQEVNHNPQSHRHSCRRYHPYVHYNTDHSGFIQHNEEFNDNPFHYECPRLCRKLPYEFNNVPFRYYPNYNAITTPVVYSSPETHFCSRSCRKCECPVTFKPSLYDCYVDW